MGDPPSYRRAGDSRRSASRRVDGPVPAASLLPMWPATGEWRARPPACQPRGPPASGVSTRARRSLPGTKVTVEMPSTSRSRSAGTIIGPGVGALPGTGCGNAVDDRGMWAKMTTGVLDGKPDRSFLSQSSCPLPSWPRASSCAALLNRRSGRPYDRSWTTRFPTCLFQSLQIVHRYRGNRARRERRRPAAAVAGRGFAPGYRIQPVWQGARGRRCGSRSRGAAASTLRPSQVIDQRRQHVRSICSSRPSALCRTPALRL